MTATHARLVDVFAETGVLCAENGVLPDALAELAVRLDLAGCGPLLDELVATRWETDPRYSDDALADKKPTNPVPPPPPPPKKPGGK